MTRALPVPVLLVEGVCPRGTPTRNVFTFPFPHHACAHTLCMHILLSPPPPPTSRTPRYVGAAVHAYRQGLLTKEDVAAVVAASKQEFAAEGLVHVGAPKEGVHFTDVRDAFRRDCEVAAVVT